MRAVPAEKKGEENEEKRFDYVDRSDRLRMCGTDKLPDGNDQTEHDGDRSLMSITSYSVSS